MCFPQNSEVETKKKNSFQSLKVEPYLENWRAVGIHVFCYWAKAMKITKPTAKKS